MFKNKCWVAVLGDRRHEISAIDAYNYYRSRYDIEHFFKFSKTKLLIDKYQHRIQRMRNAGGRYV